MRRIAWNRELGWRIEMTVLKLKACKHGNTDECVACYDEEIARLRAALSAVKSWDIGNALGVLSASGEARFSLPENIRKQVQDALGPNVRVERRACKRSLG
jgi:hypothetical protein